MIRLAGEPGRDADGIATIRFDTPGEKVNLLTEKSLELLAQILDRLEAPPGRESLRGVLLTSGKPGTFLAGADVKAFVEVAGTGDARLAASKAAAGQALFSRLAGLPVPTLAAINGACLGGGLEMALACTARIAADSLEVKLGLPEVKLGLIPGWGGTQRLPRLLGASRALGLILTGRNLTAHQAKRVGLVDAVVPAEGIEAAARAELLNLISGRRPRRPRKAFLDSNAATRALVFRRARKKALEQTRGHYPAPLAAIDTVRYGLGRGLREGLAREAQVVGELMVGAASRNLVGLFLAGRASASQPDSPGKPAPIERIGVLGAGTMGGGIAAVSALSGIPVRLKDVSAEALARGMAQVHRLAEDRARKRLLPAHEVLRRRALVAPTVDSSGFSRCDLVIEAVVEDLDIKRQVVRQVEELTRPETIVATNTSSLSVAEIARGSSRPGRILGLHFFNPVEKMPLVELVRTAATDPSAVEAALRFARRIGKTPVLVRDTPGFIVNRILSPYLSLAMMMLGSSGRAGQVRVIDQAMERFGLPMGPFELLDRIGIDVALKVSGVLEAAFASRPGWAGDGRLLGAMVRAGLVGAKVGRGFYRHDARKGRPRALSPELQGLLPSVKDGSGRGAPRGREEIATILVDSMVNEAAHLLGEGAVERPDVIDLAMVFGTGFPPFRGGPLRHADAVGRDRIAARIEARGVPPARLLLEEGRFYP